MQSRFSRRIGPYVGHELVQARQARAEGDGEREFAHLERAHVLGQASTFWHVRVHALMLMWALRHRDLREVAGQVVRIVGAAAGTVVGLVPAGNTGGTNVSPFRRMPVEPDLATLIEKARTGL